MKYHDGNESITMELQVSRSRLRYDGTGVYLNVWVGMV